MRIKTRLAGAQLALVSGSGTTSWTMDGEGIFGTEVFPHGGEHNAPESMGRNGQF
jgi:hypothetical protein